MTGKSFLVLVGVSLAWLTVINRVPQLRGMLAPN